MSGWQTLPLSIEFLEPQKPYRPDTQQLALHRRAIRNDILSRLPSVDLGRALLHYDTENVSWMHCCYHAPSFRRECDLLWAELDNGAQDTEINWSFLALLFSVLLSAAYYLPQETFAYLFPGRTQLELAGTWLGACTQCLHEADWMRSHSLYAVQAVAIMASAAVNSGKADMYFTLLGAAIRVAQALNLHRLGPDPNPQEPDIAREVRKRTWYQLLYQDAFHVAFNGACSIQYTQFNTPKPVHCIDEMLDHGFGLTVVPLSVPTADSHVSQLHRRKRHIYHS